MTVRLLKKGALLIARAKFGDTAWVDKFRTTSQALGITTWVFQVGDRDPDGRQRLRGRSGVSFEAAFDNAEPTPSREVK